MRIDERPLASYVVLACFAFTSMNIRLFIQEVKKRRVLWDPVHRQNHDKYSMDDEWLTIAKIFNVEVHTAKQKWKNLRDTFRIELKKNKRYSLDSEGNSRNSWAYYQDMYFLKNILKTRKTADFNGGTSSDPFPENIRVKQEPEITLSPTRLTEGDIESGNIVIENVSSLNTDQSDDVDTTNESTNIRENKKRRLNDDYDANDNQDDDLLFFRSLLPFVKRLDPDKKLVFRMNVQQMLYNQLYD